jgi:hypothetical protein
MLSIIGYSGAIIVKVRLSGSIVDGRFVKKEVDNSGFI